MVLLPSVPPDCLCRVLPVIWWNSEYTATGTPILPFLIWFAVAAAHQPLHLTLGLCTNTSIACTRCFACSAALCDAAATADSTTTNQGKVDCGASRRAPTSVEPVPGRQMRGLRG